MTTTNAYWDAVREYVDPTGSLWGTPEVGGYNLYRDGQGEMDYRRWCREAPSRHDLVEQYSWTITDPATVAFVVKHAGPRVVDPMAGSGWWAKLLAEAGADVVAYDLALAGPDNEWHKAGVRHASILRGDAVDTVAAHRDRTLLLSWPPYGFDATPVLNAYPGDRLIYIGEDWGGCCADDGFFEALTKSWTRIAEHVPVQWYGIHDVVHVYTRQPEGCAS
ncbi:MAG TPA: hypothetical protein VGD39_09690 [Nocardioides sp.]